MKHKTCIDCGGPCHLEECHDMTNKIPIRTIITDLKTKPSGSMQDYMDAIKKIEEIVK